VKEGVDPNMSSSRIISLFSERPEIIQRPSSFLVSILAHIGGFSLLSFGFIYTPDIRDTVITKRYTVRHLDMHTPDEKLRQSAANGVAFPGPHSDAPKPVPGEKPAAHEEAPRQTANAEKGIQTLIQPDLPDPVKVTVLTPVPKVVLWTPQKQPVKNVVAPLPEKATAADVKPSLNAPNSEIDLGDLGISSTDMPTQSIAVAPTTTSPVRVHGPKMVQLAPVTTSQTAATPTPTAVMSINDLIMPDGTATLPPVNIATEQNKSGILAPGQASSGTKGAKTGGLGKDEASGEGGTTSGAPGAASVARPGPPTGADDALSTNRFTLPKDGQFGAVVVGASLEEKFPEMSGIWNDRVAYTVYLHVGLAKSWILQYSLPRSSEATQAGNVQRLDAPWPYNIVRPNIGPGMFNSDAILVHGFVNQAGRFEALAIAFPPDFQQSQFVLDALNQWQFRPAEQNGQTEKVEVLLIIPEEFDQSSGQMQ
jgi:hypothetical protein